jgi:hypothetical protein
MRDDLSSAQIAQGKEDSADGRADTAAQMPGPDVNSAGEGELSRRMSPHSCSNSALVLCKVLGPPRKAQEKEMLAGG